MGEPGIFYAKGRAWKGASGVTEALKAFFFSKGSADRDLAADRQTLAYRSRALFQNSSFAGALINSFDTNVVGTGIKARPAIDYALLGLDREYAEKWQRSVQKLLRPGPTQNSAMRNAKTIFTSCRILRSRPNS